MRSGVCFLTDRVKEKEGRGNFVTAADQASERAILQLIAETFPSDQILTKESRPVVGDVTTLQHLWVVDPLDGTNNFRFGRSYAADFRPRPAVENTSYRMEQLARAVARSDQWLKRIRKRHPDQSEDPQAHVGPIAAGEQVVAHERSEIYRIIRQTYGDALVVEMEGYGTLAAARLPQIDAIVIRSVSDNVIDKTKCDGEGWQPIAAHMASVFAFELLANYRVKSSIPTQVPGPETPPVSPQTKETTATSSGGTHPSHPPKPPNEDKIRDSFASASKPLLSWPTDLGQGEWLFRPELRSIREKIANEVESTTETLSWNPLSDQEIPGGRRPFGQSK
jgi:nucleoside phosphorylase